MKKIGLRRKQVARLFWAELDSFKVASQDYLGVKIVLKAVMLQKVRRTCGQLIWQPCREVSCSKKISLYFCRKRSLTVKDNGLRKKAKSFVKWVYLLFFEWFIRIKHNWFRSPYVL